MKLLIGSLLAAILIAPLALTGQQERASAPAEIAKCEEGCDCKKCKKKKADSADKELLAGGSKGCGGEKGDKEKAEAESLLAHCGKCAKDKDGHKDKKKDKDGGESELLAA